MRSAFEDARLLAHAGRFGEAADCLDKRDRRDNDASTWALCAEVFERCGRIQEAKRIVDRILSRACDEPLAKASALLTRGTIWLELKQIQQAKNDLMNAALCARSAHAQELVGWTELRLLLTEVEDGRATTGTTEINRVRNIIDALNDPILDAASWVFLTELYTKRGQLAEAKDALACARGASVGRDNPWLDTLVATGGFCIAYLECDYKRAEVFAAAALHHARVSAHARSELTAIINLAHLRMRQGKLDESDRLLRRALGLCDISPRCRDYVLDGLAQLAVQRGDVAESIQLSDDVLAGVARHSYTRAWGTLTRAEALLQLAKYSDCEVACLDALAEASVSGDQGLAIRADLLLARAHAARNEQSRAGVCLLRVAAQLDPTMVGLSIEYDRTVEMLLAREGHHLTARQKRDRAISWAAGTEKGRSSAAPGETSCVRPCDTRRGEIAVAVCEGLVALESSFGNAATAAAEVVRIIEASELFDRWAVIRVGEGTRRVVQHLHGWSLHEALAAFTDDPGCPSISLGRDDKCFDVRVCVHPCNTVASFVFVHTIRLMVEKRTKGAPPVLVVSRAPSADDQRTSIIDSAMRRLLSDARRAALGGVPILVTGETGTGKEWLARYIHSVSQRSGERFIAFNVCAVPKDMIESQLFGHRKGAFTGALSETAGVIRGASGGTVLLDEIGDLPLEHQVKLLRVLDTHEVHPLGASSPSKVDIRFIVATNRDLVAMMGKGEFREDLYYRLSVVSLRVPPLRERRSEVLALARRSLAEAASENKKGALRLDKEAEGCLRQYSWPGNVRQLVNEMRRIAVLASADAVVGLDMLSPYIVNGNTTAAKPEAFIEVDIDQSLASAIAVLERAMIERALQVCGGELQSAAALLGVSRKGLYLKRRRLELLQSERRNDI